MFDDDFHHLTLRGIIYSDFNENFGNFPCK